MKTAFDFEAIDREVKVMGPLDFISKGCCKGEFGGRRSILIAQTSSLSSELPRTDKKHGGHRRPIFWIVHAGLSLEYVPVSW